MLILADQLLVYRRFVNDVLMLFHGDILLEDILAHMNTWRPGEIMITRNDEAQNQTSSLDVYFSIELGRVNYRTFRKGHNGYQYTPFISKHSNATLFGIVHTEAIRLLRTSSTDPGFEWQRSFFLIKLALKGYPVVKCAKMLNGYTFESQQAFLKPRVKSA